MAACEAVTVAGERCGAYALKSGRYCFAHEPGMASTRARARRLGGQRRGSHAGDRAGLPASVRSAEDILAVLDYTLAELSQLDNGIPRARALIALAAEYSHALEIGEFEGRLLALEEHYAKTTR